MDYKIKRKIFKSNDIGLMVGMVYFVLFLNCLLINK